MKSLRMMLAMGSAGVLAFLGLAQAPDVNLPLSVPAVGETAPPSGPPEVVNGHLVLGFDRLAGFVFNEPWGTLSNPLAPAKMVQMANAQIPAEVRQWSGRKAVVTGYMLPLKMEKGLVSEFLLQRYPMSCCYSTAPVMNEWVLVKLKKPAPMIMDEPVAVSGLFRVDPVFNGSSLQAIFGLAGDKVEKAEE